MIRQPEPMRRLLPILVFATVALSVLGGAHYYLVKRLVIDPGWSVATSELLLVAVAVLALSIIVYFVAERLLAPPWTRIAAWPPAIWMGFAFLCLVLLGASDFAFLLLGADGVGELAALRAVAVAGVAGVVTIATVPRALRPPDVKHITVELPRWPAALDGYRIAQISDVHIGPILGKGFARGVVERVNALEPDLVAVTGDLVDGPVAHLRADVAPFGELRGRDGVFFVTGNHDHYSHARSWVAYLRSLGLRVLRNERVRIERDGAAFDLAGVEDAHAAQVDPAFREDLDAALAGRDATAPVVLLAHDPSTFVRARQRSVDLQLSGHTHGGQIWPFRYVVRLAIPWVAGLYRDGPSALYVSRGTGFWGPPMRLGAPAEITLLELRAPSGARATAH